MVRPTVISRLMAKMTSRVRPMLISMSLTMILIIWYSQVFFGSSQTKTRLASNSWQDVLEKCSKDERVTCALTRASISSIKRIPPDVV